YDVSARYLAEGVPLIVLAGAEYGSGSSRDWAAKGTALLGVRAVIAKSFERIHRSNLVQMGVFPLEFTGNDDAASLGLSGRETFDNNVYVVRAVGSDDALIVDGAADAERILKEVAGLNVVGIVETHGHADHVQALPDLVSALGVTVYAHGGDASKMPVSTQPLRDAQTMVVGDIELSVFHTPGHTPGSLSF